MSGIEVAGLVLGAFPILISALEHYRETAVVISTWWRFEREYNNFKYEVEYQQRRFKQNLEIYLLPLILDDDKLLQSLLASPGGPKWKDKQLGQRLGERIPESYDLYMETINAMNGVMEKIKEKLAVGKSNPEHEVKRFVFSLDQSPRNELLEKMEKYNNRLRELLDTSDKVTDLKRNQSVAKAQRGLLSFWNHANAIYTLLQGAWRRRCCHSHHVNLLLQHRRNPEVEFTVLFHAGDKTGEPGTNLWIWQNIGIKLFETRTSGVSLSIAVPLVSQQPPQSVSKTVPMSNTSNTKRDWKKIFKPLPLAMKRNDMSAHSAPAPSIKMKANFDVPRSGSPNTNTPTKTTQNNPALITDLCDTLSIFSSIETSSGILKDDENQYLLFPNLKRQDTSDTRQTVTLESLLNKSSPVLLTRRDRHFIALSIASSQLQLHPTPWLGSQWKKSDIHFLLDVGNGKKALLDQPYLSRDFVPNTRAATSTPPGGDFSFCSLGIMLLELSFYITLEDYPPRKLVSNAMPSLDPTAELIWDHTIAMQWCNSAADEVGPEYADAVRWCLERTFSRKSQWREEFLQEVVEPLQRCYNHLAGVKYEISLPCRQGKHGNG